VAPAELWDDGVTAAILYLFKLWLLLNITHALAVALLSADLAKYSQHKSSGCVNPLL
jgi:hypothetical protein